jgi:L-methionine (R)-S-oxide reductase
MNPKSAKYNRLVEQLRLLLAKDSNLIAQLATINALLYHKMQNFFWIGFYFKIDNQLIVGPYQGPVACQILPFPNGVCWACVNKGESIIVEDVNNFPGHIACDSRSKAEIVLPLKNSRGETIAVFDIDSDKLNQFDNDDLIGLTNILGLINSRLIDVWK